MIPENQFQRNNDHEQETVQSQNILNTSLLKVLNRLSVLDKIDNAQSLDEDLFAEPKLLKTFDLVFFSSNSYLMRHNFGAHASKDSVAIGKHEFPRLVQQLVHHPVTQQLLPHLWDVVAENEQHPFEESIDARAQLKFALALLLAHLPLEDMPETLRERIGNIPHLNNYTLLDFDEHWDLCSSAEQNFMRSASEPINGVVFVDNSLLVKVSNGIMTALCLNPIATDEGIFLPGIWYSPLNPTRETFRELYDCGLTSYSSSDKKIRWVLQRPLGVYRDFIPLDQSPEQMLAFYRDYAKSLPQNATPEIVDNSTGRMIDRQGFRRIHQHDSDRSIISGL